MEGRDPRIGVRGQAMHGHDVGGVARRGQMESFAKVLSAGSRELLRIIVEKAPGLHSSTHRGSQSADPGTLRFFDLKIR